MGTAVTINFATAAELARWDDLILANPDGGDVWRSRAYAEQKRLGHYTPRYIVVHGTELDNDKTFALPSPSAAGAGSDAEVTETEAWERAREAATWLPEANPWAMAFTVHEKSVPFVGKLWYLPKGPGFETLAEMAWVTRILADFAKDHGAFMLKIEPRLTFQAAADSLESHVAPLPPGPDSNDDPTGSDSNDDPHAELRAARAAVRADLISEGFVETLPIIPNASTVIVDLATAPGDITDGSIKDVLLANIGQKARYAINRARRDGVTIEQVDATDANCVLMFGLLADTAEGAFGIRSRAYYTSFWKSFAASGQGQFFFAFFEGQLVAGAFAMIFGNRSTYKDGASLRQKTGYGASHLMQFEVMIWARSRGSISHDLCGSPAADEVANTEHPFYGIGLFKTSFCPNVTDYIGVWDYPLNALKYRFWVSFAERAARRLSLIVRKDPYY
jgi:lipid II:glycine glycyltransferase (peptidoglycan interpeptide bridge formation enzyme)